MHRRAAHGLGCGRGRRRGLVGAAGPWRVGEGASGWLTETSGREGLE